jgi:type IV secretory pathway TrbD component
LLWQRRLVSAKVAAAAAAVSLVVPSFIAPGAGIVVLAVSAAVAHARSDRRLAKSSVSLS